MNTSDLESVVAPANHPKLNKRFLTTKEVANLIGKHYKWVESKRYKGGGPVFRYIGKTPIYEEKDVLEWMGSIPKIQNTSQPR